MTEQKVSSRYAKALLDTSTAESLNDIVVKDLDLVKNMINSSRDLSNFIKSPIISETQKRKVFDELLSDKVHKLTLNFINVLLEKGRESLIVSIIIQFENLYNLRNNRVKVEIKSASELTEDIKSKVLNKLTEVTGKIILPKFFVDKSLKGGLSIRVEDWVYDASLKTQLELLRQSLSEGK